jgi:non-specific serine/threonine protein kinase
MSISLSPQGHIHWEHNADSGLGSARESALASAAEQSSARLLLHLATRELDGVLPLAAAYWREFGRKYLTAFCHTPAPESAPTVPPGEGGCAYPCPYCPALAEAEFEAMADSAPPMRGAEYLRAEILRGLWQELDALVVSEVRTFPGGVQAWLRAQNPAWNLVGRVTFHLAENKKNPERPFAFLATYTHRLSAQARPQYLPLGNALREYAGARNKEALLSLLMPVRRAAETSELARELIDSQKIFQPQSWSPREAHRFLKEIPVFEQSGVLVRLPDWWKSGRALRPRVSVKVGQDQPSGVGLGALLDFKAAVTLDGEELTEAEWQAIRSSTEGLVFLRGKWVESDPEKLQEVLAHWKKIEQARASEGVSFAEAFRMLAGIKPGDSGAGPEEEAVKEWSYVHGGEWIERQLAELREPQAAEGELPSGFNAQLRPYQMRGIHWLRFMGRLGLGACLADDMGLGKTVQVLAALQHWRNESPSAAPALLVVPASLLGNWQSEAAKFAPGLRIAIAHPSGGAPDVLGDEKKIQRAFASADLVATTYGMVARQGALRRFPWSGVILDEAQAIKNPGSRQTKAVKELGAPVRVALTGTPVENSLGDLWSIFDFLNPGLLGSAPAFSRLAKGVSRSEDPARFAPLRKLVRPFILRRLKTDRSIISDLPDKTEMRAFCPLSKRQAALYEQAVKELEEQLESVEGIGRRGLILGFLMRLKQLCNHPAQFLGGEFAPEESGKFGRLAQIAEEVASRQEKALVFTQFREMTGPLAHYLADIFGRQGLVLHGATGVKERRAMVESFQREEGPPFFILSLKAGGTGLTLTEAAHVIHFDRWWNPAVENQATDRAFRIGQKKNVLVHKFICRGTVEEKIDQLIEAKRSLAEGVLAEGAEMPLTEMSNEELLRFVALDTKNALCES